MKKEAEKKLQPPVARSLSMWELPCRQKVPREDTETKHTAAAWNAETWTTKTF
jgi:hypothetical protein